MKEIRGRQHEALRVPNNWRDQDRAFVIQLERILDDLYGLLGNLEKRVKQIEEESENAGDTESSTETT